MGHDFRPEYRNLKNIKNNWDAFIGLTATATPKFRNILEKFRYV
jgi:superfamily II DNA helicase RecQ